VFGSMPREILRRKPLVGGVVVALVASVWVAVGGAGQAQSAPVQELTSTVNGSDGLRYSVTNHLVRGFEPDLLLVSAGFDAHAEDPLAWMEVSTSGFRELARRCRGLAPRLAAVLEGGYNLETLPALVLAALDGFS